MSTPTKVEAAPSPATLNDVLIRGDLSKLTEPQRTEYYLNVCRSLGLNPLTQPFAYLTLSGKLVLYAKRDAADQLRKLNGISVEIIGREINDGLLIVHAHAKDKGGRTDEDFGVVAFKGGGGEFAANAMMKAVTKAKRRVTLSISGLGFLDETEVDDIPANAPELPAAHALTVPLLPNSTHRDWRAFATDLLDHIRASGERVPWLEANKDTLATMETRVPSMHANLMAAIGNDRLKAEDYEETYR